MCIRDRICTITTLAPLAEAQKLDGLDEFETSKRYMHHYNFPSYSVGETKPSRGPGRREIGHGALAERALVPVLPSEEEFPYAIRTVSETLIMGDVLKSPFLRTWRYPRRYHRVRFAFL